VPKFIVKVALETTLGAQFVLNATAFTTVVVPTVNGPVYVADVSVGVEPSVV
jgi:hypothetical protein